MENKYSGMLAWEEGILYLCEEKGDFFVEINYNYQTRKF
jgi:hypothetical protein